MISNNANEYELTRPRGPHQPRGEGGQGWPALQLLGPHRRRRRQRPRRRRSRQGQRGAGGDPQGRRAGEEEPLRRPARAARPFPTRSRATSAPARCCSSRPAKVPASSPAARSARCWRPSASATCSPSARVAQPAQRGPGHRRRPEADAQPGAARPAARQGASRDPARPGELGSYRWSSRRDMSALQVKLQAQLGRRSRAAPPAPSTGPRPLQDRRRAGAADTRGHPGMISQVEPPRDLRAAGPGLQGHRPAPHQG